MGKIDLLENMNKYCNIINWLLRSVSNDKLTKNTEKQRDTTRARKRASERKNEMHIPRMDSTMVCCSLDWGFNFNKSLSLSLVYVLLFISFPLHFFLCERFRRLCCYVLYCCYGNRGSQFPFCLH